MKNLSGDTSSLGEKRKHWFFLRDTKNVAANDARVLIRAKGNVVAGVNCGACGYGTYGPMGKVFRKKIGMTVFSGPDCAVRMTDLGIAVGSAVKTARIHNVDNRVMFSAGVAARYPYLPDPDRTVVYGVPCFATGKNIYFDRP